MAWIISLELLHHLAFYFWHTSQYLNHHLIILLYQIFLPRVFLWSSHCSLSISRSLCSLSHSWSTLRFQSHLSDSSSSCSSWVSSWIEGRSRAGIDCETVWFQFLGISTLPKCPDWMNILQSFQLSNSHRLLNDLIVRALVPTTKIVANPNAAMASIAGLNRNWSFEFSEIKFWRGSLEFKSNLLFEKVLIATWGVFDSKSDSGWDETCFPVLRAAIWLVGFSAGLVLGILFIISRTVRPVMSIAAPRAERVMKANCFWGESCLILDEIDWQEPLSVEILSSCEVWLGWLGPSIPAKQNW